MEINITYLNNINKNINLYNVINIICNDEYYINNIKSYKHIKIRYIIYNRIVINTKTKIYNINFKKGIIYINKTLITCLIYQ